MWARVTTLEEQSPLAPPPSVQLNGVQSLSGGQDSQAAENTMLPQSASNSNGGQSLSGGQDSQMTDNTTKREQSSHLMSTPGHEAEQSQSSNHFANHTSVPEEPQGWGDQPDDETPDYEEQIFWEPVDSDSDSEHRQISSATARVVQEAFSQTLSSQR